MLRTCNGHDVNLLDDAVTAAPCACGLTFDDVDRSVIWPHPFIPTEAEKAALRAALDTIVLEQVPA